MTAIRLDLDGDATLDRDALAFLTTVLELDGPIAEVEYRTARGRHVELRLSCALPPLAIVAVQAMLGSDVRREIFNLVRALSLGDAPAFWHARWNVLYAEKLRGVDTMINPDEYGQGKPSLKVEDIGDADIAVLTIAGVEELEIEQDGETRKKLVVSFDEFPDKGYWCNVTAIKTLVGKLGNNESRWTGREVPLVRAMTRNPQTKKQQEVLWVADGEKWDDLIAQSGRRRKARTAKGAGAKKATVKRR